MKVPYEALAEIRRIRALSGGRQGTTEVKRELKILLALRDGIPWETAGMMEIDHIQSRRDGGNESASNLRLLTQTKNQQKGAHSETSEDLSLWQAQRKL